MTKRVANLGHGVWNILRSLFWILRPGSGQMLLLSLAGLIADIRRFLFGEAEE